MIVDNFEIIKSLLKFEDENDFYFLQIIQRKKDGEDIPQSNRNNGYRTIKSYYIRSLEEFDSRVERIKQLCKQNNARAYINLNVRSAKEVALEAAKAYIDLVRENRCYQGFRVYDHVCGITPKIGEKKKWIVDIDNLTKEQIDIIYDKICRCRSAYKITDIRYLKTLSEDLYDNIIAEIPTVHGVHIITRGFDVSKFREMLEQTSFLTKEQIKEIITVKKDNLTLLYYETTKE